jgi:hypothetical protein
MSSSDTATSDSKKQGINLDGANETDVREEIAAPLLAALGYRRGTQNDILREYHLKYAHIFLGRKKPKDPPLRGKADYILSVLGSGRWVLETKPPSEDITVDAIEQALSYARHPEISGSYAVVMNGRRLVVMQGSQRSSDKPLVDIEVQSVEDLANTLSRLLSPQAIKRDCSPPVVDLDVPIAEGFRSSAQIASGTIAYSNFSWDCNMPVPPETRENLDEMCRRMSSFRIGMTGGSIWRDENSRVRVKPEWSLPHDAIVAFAQNKQLMDMEYLSLDSTISSQRGAPTVFDVTGSVYIAEGETLFDMQKWDTTVADLAMSMSYRGQAIGHIENGTFRGDIQVEYDCSFPVDPSLSLGMFGAGSIEIILDPR